MNAISNSRRWNNALHFTVEVGSPSDRLYANGLQQVQLRVGLVVADDNGDLINLRDDDIRSLVLIQYAGGREIPYADPLSGASATTVEWDWSNVRDARYKFSPATVSLPEANGLELASLDFVYRDFWVRSKASSPLLIAAKVTMQDGTVFTSAQMPSGFVTLIPEAVPASRISDYTLKPTTISNKGIEYDYVPFVMRHRGVLMEFAHFTMTPVSISKHSNTARPGTVHAVFTGHTAVPGEGQVSYARSNSGLPGRVLDDYLRPGQPIILVVSSTFNLSQSPVPDPTSAARITAVDRFGNPHRLTLTFTSRSDRMRQIQLA